MLVLVAKNELKKGNIELVVKCSRYFRNIVTIKNIKI